MEALLRAMQELVVANRILATEGVCDAFGHASVRHPDNSDRYIMARSRSPGVITIDDLMEYTLDGEPIDQRDRAMYAERHIHGGVYEKRPDALAVIHNHSSAIIPFGVTGVALRPILHMGSVAGGDIPTWDIHDKFGDTHLLVTNMDQGRDLATCLGDRRVVRNWRSDRAPVPRRGRACRAVRAAERRIGPGGRVMQRWWRYPDSAI